VESAAEAGLQKNDVALELLTQGFSAGITIDDPLDGAIVARGRTVLKKKELDRSLLPALRYLGIPKDSVGTRVHDGAFEVRIARTVAESHRPALGAAHTTLRIWIGFGLLGLAAYFWLPPFTAAIFWGLGLALGGMNLRRGLATGRSMLAARVAIGLAMISQEEKLILPPAEPEGGAGA
jgi:hypothetical protein